MCDVTGLDAIGNVGVVVGHPECLSAGCDHDSGLTWEVSMRPSSVPHEVSSFFMVPSSMSFWVAAWMALDSPPSFLAVATPNIDASVMLPRASSLTSA